LSSGKFSFTPLQFERAIRLHDLIRLRTPVQLTGAAGSVLHCSFHAMARVETVNPSPQRNLPQIRVKPRKGPNQPASSPLDLGWR
jgi:hypothetical protein